jgi:hypothetical protein
MTVATACRTCGTAPREGARLRFCGSLIARLAAPHVDDRLALVLNQNGAALVLPLKAGYGDPGNQPDTGR